MFSSATEEPSQVVREVTGSPTEYAGQIFSLINKMGGEDQWDHNEMVEKNKPFV